MKLVLSLTLGLLALATNLAAQTSLTNYAVYFKSDEDKLDASDIEILQPILVQLKGPNYAEINLKAHADYESDVSYNQQLSERRCNAVRGFLLSNGIDAKRITSQSFGELKPKLKDKSQKAKALNRRVDIELETFSTQNVQTFLSLVGGNLAQEFRVNAAKPIKIVGKGGLQIEIPANAFVNQNNQAISSNNISISMQELFGPREAFTQQLSTMSNGKILETGGMFSIEASQGTNKLKLKEGASIEVKLPSSNLVNGMQVFLPVIDASTGIKEWKPTVNAFELTPAKKVELPFVYFDTTALRKFKVSELDMNPLPNLVFGSVPWPARPNCPKAPKQPVLATKNELFNFAERVFYSSAFMEKELMEINRSRQKSYDRAFLSWQNKYRDYEYNMEKYKFDSAAFEFATRDTFMNWLMDTEKQLNVYVKDHERQFFNQGIERFCKASSLKKLTGLNLKSVFFNAAKPNKTMSKHFAIVAAYLHKISILKNSSMAEVIKLAGDKSNQISLNDKKLNYNIRYFNHYYTNSFAVDMMDQNIELKQLFRKAESEIIDLREAAGMLDNRDVAMIYSASLGQTGLYNCDRFNGTPPTQMARIYINAPQNARVSFYVKEINAFIYAYPDKKGYYVDLPKNKKVKLLAFALNENAEPILGQTELIVKEEVRLTPQLERVSVKELRLTIANI